MKSEINTYINQAVQACWNVPIPEGLLVMDNKEDAHGDYSTNVAFLLAKTLGKSPQTIAEPLRDWLAEHAPDDWMKIEIAGKGFINFFMDYSKVSWKLLSHIQAEDVLYGTHPNQDQSILLEFVSANPTGPLHVGHGRAAILGDCLANVLENAGYRVDREYYLNDAGRQMRILALSLWLRYLSVENSDLPFVAGGYQGAYLEKIAIDLWESEAAHFYRPLSESFQATLRNTKITADEQLDFLCAKMHEHLGQMDYQALFEKGLQAVLALIKNDLECLGVRFDSFAEERKMFAGEPSPLQGVLTRLSEKGLTYEKDGALWFSSVQFGDDKDRVLCRANGEYTYFASDCAYHDAKYLRQYSRLINIWGSDHHGYQGRLRAAMNALGHDESRFQIDFVQFVNLFEDGKRLAMSTRSGEFVDVADLVETVGLDAVRFYYIVRPSQQHVDFDLAVARRESKDNAIYYIQYAHARIVSVFAKTEQPSAFKQTHYHFDTSHEQALIHKLGLFPSTTSQAAKQHAPYLIALYLKELAALFHAYYNEYKVNVEDKNIRQARLMLLEAVRIVLVKGFNLLGIKPRNRMLKEEKDA